MNETVTVLLSPAHYLRDSCAFWGAAHTAEILRQKILLVLKP